MRKLNLSFYVETSCKTRLTEVNDRPGVYYMCYPRWLDTVKKKHGIGWENNKNEKTKRRKVMPSRALHSLRIYAFVLDFTRGDAFLSIYYYQWRTTGTILDYRRNIYLRVFYSLARCALFTDSSLPPLRHTSHDNTLMRRQRGGGTVAAHTTQKSGRRCKYLRYF